MHACIKAHTQAHARKRILQLHRVVMATFEHYIFHLFFYYIFGFFFLYFIYCGGELKIGQKGVEGEQMMGEPEKRKRERDIWGERRRECEKGKGIRWEVRDKDGEWGEGDVSSNENDRRMREREREPQFLSNLTYREGNIGFDSRTGWTQNPWRSRGPSDYLNFRRAVKI